MTDTLTGIVADACLVTFTGLTGDLEGARVLTGTVLKDYAGRFRTGDAFVSSRVIQASGDIVRTHNSTYQIQGSVDHIDLPSQAIPLVSALVDPREVQRLLEITPVASEGNGK